MSSEPSTDPVRIDKMRASREGHTYHDTWTARVALELLVPATTLSAVAVEGLSTEDAPIASNAATEIADLVRYRGGVGIAQASSVEVVQFKYSIAQAAAPMRATDLRNEATCAWLRPRHERDHASVTIRIDSDHAVVRSADTIDFQRSHSVTSPSNLSARISCR
jgi:hypothetical protein